MGMGQTMVTVAFLVLLTFLVLNANRLILDTETNSLSSQAIDLANDLAQGLLTEVARKKYDQNVSAGDTVQPAFTSPSRLGPETGETVTVPEPGAPYLAGTVYNDVDDYNNYSRIANGVEIKGFVLSVSVYYILGASNTTTHWSSTTNFKRVDVTIQHPLYLPSGLVYSRIFTY